MRFLGNGIAAIVGPNGCGKSNLSDAISWVLGEQSAKTLRGTRMEDVIFAGTRERKPLSMAQVTVTMADPAGHLAEMTNGNGHEAMPSEITITRRLYRDGNSDYLIDGKMARLRDIQDIFTGTGLGPESYAIIEQGRIGQLLSSKPSDRRAVIEEAAGIGRFKTKRRLAEAKLENAKQNLARVFDILEEVGRQASSLKRQAAKARRYQELHKELVVALRRALVGKFWLLEREATKVALELNQLNMQFHQVSNQVAEKEKEQHQVIELRYAVEAELTATRERLAQLRLEAERTRGRMDSQAREIAGMESRLAQGEIEVAGLEGSQAQANQELESHARQLADLEQNVEDSRARLEEKTQERDALQQDLRQREQTIEDSRQQILVLISEVSSLQNQVAQVVGYLQSLDRDRSRLQREEQMASADLERLEARKRDVSDALGERQMELESLADQRRRVDTSLQDRKSAAAQTRILLQQVQQDASHLKARKDSLDEILSHRAYTTESIKRLFTAFQQGQAQELRPMGVLADFVDVDPSHEKAAEEFLHDELEYVLVKGRSQAEAGIDLMRTDLDGRATFLVHPEPGDAVSTMPGAEPAIGPETGITSRLSDVLKLTNGLTQAPAALLPRLARCFLAEDRAAAQRLSQQYPDYYFLLNDGVCYHGHAISGGRKTGSGPLALKRELRELTTQSAAKQRELEQAALQLRALEHETHFLEEELERVRTQQQGQEREALALDHEMRRLAEEFSRANSKLSVSRLEIQRIDKEAAKAAAQKTSNLALVAEKEQLRLSREEALAQARGALDELQAAMARITEEHSALRVEMAERDERRRAEKSAQERLERQVQDLARRRQELAEMIERLGTERARLLDDNIRLDELAGKLAGEIELTDGQANTLATSEQQQREKLAAMEEELREIRQQMQTLQQQRGQIEVNLAERRAELRYLDETSQKELKASLEDLARGEETVLDEIGLAEAEEKYQSLRARIENLGAVNPDALQEYEEAQQRYDFLNTQRQDLLDSIRDTEKAIQELDTESRKRFTEAFEAINANFTETFTKLFGGGVAEMRLTDEANINESGVDIVASPPGKRLQNVLLLSGGEKALTALSLLMAIFRYTPSPFCILDEVDAPLDEPNIQRLMGLLREMSDTTQFILITHAKRTMEVASSLYGVTMQEPGVSKLVSVKFNGSPPPPPVPQTSAQAAGRPS